MSVDKNGYITIHQLLHGYDEGHCLLAGSIKPDNQSARTILSLSDLANQGLVPGHNGYITGYPLPKMNAYAYARTWSAPEMKRPGCVWTHTLLIDFTDLVVLSDAISILDLFNRPLNVRNLTQYNQLLNLNANKSSATYNFISINALYHLLKALYEFNDGRVFAEVCKDTDPDLATTVIWLQQWPRLRRNFRFCTLTQSDRSRPGEIFDLQFYPSLTNLKENALKTNRDVIVDIESPLPEIPDDLLTILTTDAIAGNMDSDLRKFLWRYGAESDAGRRVFIPLTKIWIALKKKPQPDFETACNILNKYKPISDSLVLGVLQNIINLSIEPNCFSSSVIDFFIENLPLIDKIEFQNENAARILFECAPENIWPLFFSESGLLRSLASTAMSMMPEDKVINKITDNEILFSVVVSSNPRIVESPLLWSSLSSRPHLIDIIIPKIDHSNLAVLHAMFESDNKNIPALSIKLFGQDAISLAIDKYDNNSKYKQKAITWLVNAKKYPNFIQSALLTKKDRNIETLDFLSSLINYRLSSKFPDVDEWAVALDHVRGNISKRPFSLCAFLLAKALSGISPEPSKLIKFSFDSIHYDLMNFNYDYDAWSMLERELPNTVFWGYWGKAKRVRLGVVNLFILQDLPAIDFIEITNNSKVFEELIQDCCHHKDGYKYLRKVYSWIVNNGRFEDKKYLNIIENNI